MRRLQTPSYPGRDFIEILRDARAEWERLLFKQPVQAVNPLNTEYMRYFDRLGVANVIDRPDTGVIEVILKDGRRKSMSSYGMKDLFDEISDFARSPSPELIENRRGKGLYLDRPPTQLIT